MSTRKSKHKRIKITPEELEKRNHRKEIRAIFNRAGFKKVASVSDKEITFKKRTGDFDDIFIYENIIVLLEYTISKTDNISTHLLKKKVIFDHILDSPEEFVEYMKEKFPTFQESLESYYDNNQCKVVIAYCSKNSIQKEHKDQVPSIVYLDYPIVKYFKSVSEAIRISSRFELFSFLNLKSDEVGKAIVNPLHSNKTVDGTILPESHSNLKKGYKVVSFYIDPKSLLEKSYVLRKEGWKDDSGLYQRMIINNKIKSIRKYLYTQERVFINNIIVTLPNETKLLDSKNNTINPNSLTKTSPVKIQIPDGFNVVGLIDGQHRVYAYHEGGEQEDKITKLREKQNLLVTGIIYPDNIKEKDKTEFEAQLFLEINANQSNAKSDLKQAISVILKPFASESIARMVIHRLNMNGALETLFEEHFYEKGKIKTTSIVSYGLKPIVKLSGEDSFYSLWKNSDKADLLKEKKIDLLYEYIDFCVTELNIFLGAVKAHLKTTNKWTLDHKVKNKALTTTAINGFIICLRFLIADKKVKKFDAYKNALNDLENFNFSKYKSSQYGSMARDIYAKFFNNASF